MRDAWTWMRERRVAHYATLALILVTVAVVTYHPHWNPLTGRTYEYPVHMDEYVHWGYAQAIMDQGTVTFRNPFTGGAPGEFTVEEHLHERSYQAWLGVYQGVTGVEWLDLFRFGPAVIAIVLALCVYAFCERWGAGLEGALLVAAIPTTLRFLGPGFMVPIVFSLPLLVMGLHAVVHVRHLGGVVAFGILAATLWPIHVIGAFGLFALATLYALFLLASDMKRGIAILALAALPFFAAWDFYDKLLDTGVLRLPVLPANEFLLLYFGAAPLVAAVVGVAWVAHPRGGQAPAVGAMLGLGLLLTQGIILWRLYYGDDPFILYDRSYMLLYTQAAIAGGIGLGFARRLAAKLADRATRRWATVNRVALGAVTVAALVAGTGIVAASVVPQLEQPYYSIMSEKQYASYREAGELLNATHGFAIVEGLPTMPFTILAGKPTVFVHFPTSPQADPDYVRDFFRRGANDTYLLVQRGATIVVTDRPVHNPDLVPIGDGVYVLRWDYASRIVRGLEAGR